MTEIKLKKRYPQSRAEDITDAFMRGYEQGRTDGLKVGGQIILAVVDSYLTELEQTEATNKQNNRKTENNSENRTTASMQRTHRAMYGSVVVFLIHTVSIRYTTEIPMELSIS